MSHNEIYVQSGITTDGKPVMAGAYAFYETHGLPLDIIFSIFIEKGWMVDWIDLYQAAIAAGMKHKRVLSKLDSAISDTFGKEFRDVVISRLDLIFQPKDTK